MLIYAFLYIIIMKIMKRTGRITPVWGFIALIVHYVINSITTVLLVLTGKFQFIDDGYIDKSETILILSSAILSFVF